jgi:hypothetical protein
MTQSKAEEFVEEAQNQDSHANDPDTSREMQTRFRMVGFRLREKAREYAEGE